MSGQLLLPCCTLPLAEAGKPRRRRVKPYRATSRILRIYFHGNITMASTIRVAACHASPVFLNARKTTDKAISFIQQAAAHKANLIVFPETYISAFPIWSSVRPPTENHELFQRMVKQSIYADGEEMEAIREAARSTGSVVSIGFSERSRHSNGCLYNSNLIINTDGTVLVHHRKLVPTFFEKLTWSPGDGHGLQVANTRFGRIGGLICGENTNPLARYALMAQAEQVHISTWPAIWPTRTPQRPTQGNDTTSTAKPANYDNLAANRTRAAAHCFEAKCFGVACSGHLGEDAIETIIKGASQPETVAETSRAMSRAATFSWTQLAPRSQALLLHPAVMSRIQRAICRTRRAFCMPIWIWMLALKASSITTLSVGIRDLMF
tara:strand:+ start:7382 stop:8521 length:1140 start_codon:yes stop_codon:yes gene_type:complete